MCQGPRSQIPVRLFKVSIIGIGIVSIVSIVY